MGSDDVERAIAQLTGSVMPLTLDQRLRIAALLARPAPPESTPDPRPSAGRPIESVVLTVEETADLLKVGRTTVYDLIRGGGRLDSIMIARLRRTGDIADRIPAWEEFAGPQTGVVELPNRLYWSGVPAFDVENAPRRLTLTSR